MYVTAFIHSKIFLYYILHYSSSVQNCPGSFFHLTYNIFKYSLNFTYVYCCSHLYQCILCLSQGIHTFALIPLNVTPNIKYRLTTDEVAFGYHIRCNTLIVKSVDARIGLDFTFSLLFFFSYIDEPWNVE